MSRPPTSRRSKPSSATSSHAEVKRKVTAYITGSGLFAPEQSITNEELAERLGLEAEQIFKSSGIRRRRWAAQGTTTSSLAAHALRLALDDAGLKAEDVDYVLF